MNSRRLLLAFALVASSALAGGACHREHLSGNYGQAYWAWFSAQHVKSKANPELTRKVIEELDASEAAMVSRTYRRNTSGRSGDDASGQGSRLLMINPNRVGGGGEAYIPPPSVPQ
jgi:hypothetical protein